MLSCKTDLGTCWWSWHLYVPVVRIFVDLRSQSIRYIAGPGCFVLGRITRKWTLGLHRPRMISNLLFNFVNLSYALCEFWPQREDGAKRSGFVKFCKQFFSFKSGGCNPSINLLSHGVSTRTNFSMETKLWTWIQTWSNHWCFKCCKSNNIWVPSRFQVLNITVETWW